MYTTEERTFLKEKFSEVTKGKDFTKKKSHDIHSLGQTHFKIMKLILALDSL